ncbi:hypothetical protein SAMN05216214_107132 [Atopomonas hussainii]|uniref:Uncharacterized protein n=1 Tax=Atopomonas hussainii TaxID=1429083 RepID=A0A1H7LUU1_9GAMM|nr:hypothetical protein SAMN05216214_107132 [Atopomonas hussainii]
MSFSAVANQRTASCYAYRRSQYPACRYPQGNEISTALPALDRTTKKGGS